MCEFEVLWTYGEWDAGAVFCVSGAYDGAGSGGG
jgi:hypothetical protein